jgi:hypothetical protein
MLLGMRLPFFVSALAGAAFASATWTATLLHPTGATASYVWGGGGAQQVGYALITQAKAALWNGTAFSFVNLNPASATSSYALTSDGVTQVGSAMIGGKFNAGLWTGTADSWVNVTPAGAAPAEIKGMDGTLQAGYFTTGGKTHACTWHGTADSLIDLNPAGADSSEADSAGGGKQAGRAWISGQPQACIWSGTAASYVNLAPTGSTYSNVFATDGVTQVGYGLFSGQQRAGLWKGTAASFVSLHPTGANYSEAHGIYGAYQVGFAGFSGVGHAYLWKGTVASGLDLNLYLPEGFTSARAYAMWSDGATLYIGGDAVRASTNKSEAIIWTSPDPEAYTFTLNKTQVAGQNSVQGTITAAEGNADARIYTTYDNSSLVTTPATVTLPAATTVKNFQITTTAVTATINTTIYAKRNGVIKSAPLALIPLIPTALAFTPSQVVGGNSVSCRVVINGVAGPGGRTIAILDNSANATVPSTVVVPAGATQVIFDITTTPVTSQKTVTVTARVSAGEKTGTFKINPN